MIAVTKSDIKKLDEWAINELRIPEMLLMENAGKAVAQVALSSLRKIHRAVVICGGGANGGDGFVAARHLAANTVSVEVYLLCDRNRVTGSSKANLEILESMRVPVNQVSDDSGLHGIQSSLQSADLVIDAIFGVGFQGSVTGIHARAIEIVNSSKRSPSGKAPFLVVAVDVPSGIDADSGACDANSIDADITVTFSYVKKGMISYPAIDKVGKLVIADIGIPKDNFLFPGVETRSQPGEKTSDIDIIDPDYVASKIPGRMQSAHKGSCGKVLIIAGSAGMAGAAILAARAAMRSGAGLVKLAVPRSLSICVNTAFAEAIALPLPETCDGTISDKAERFILEAAKDFDVIAIGPGLTTNAATKKFIVNLFRSLRRCSIKASIVIDADALNAISTDISILKDMENEIVLTPHPGEMGRLARLTIDQVQNARAETAMKFATEHRVSVILKGARSVVCSDKGRIKINITGNPGMAAAGMGDVLTGVVAGLMGQGIAPFDACACAAFIHGMAGDVAASTKGEHGMIAGDVCESLPYVIKTIVR